MDKVKIIEILKDHEDKQAVEKFGAYMVRLYLEKKKGTNEPKNPWMLKKKEEDLCILFKRVIAEGLVFDGVHITLQSTGVSYDYVAYKNKMLLAYPESKIDVSLVYFEDKFTFQKASGLVTYSHEFSNPFEQEDSKVIGAYCVIKNKRGEFLTLLSKGELEKHRKVAKTDYIWNAWYKEMCMKTVMKKSCKVHFEDIFTEIEVMDNEQYDLEKDVTKTPLEEMTLQITEALEVYQGEDIGAIRKGCVDAKNNGKFTEIFASKVLKRLGV